MVYNTKKIKEFNQHLAQWLEERGGRDSILEQERAIMYSEFSIWCEVRGYDARTSNAFVTNMNTQFDLRLMLKSINCHFVYIFVDKDRPKKKKDPVCYHCRSATIVWHRDEVDPDRKTITHICSCKTCGARILYDVLMKGEENE